MHIAFVKMAVNYHVL